MKKNMLRRLSVLLILSLLLTAAPLSGFVSALPDLAGLAPRANAAEFREGKYLYTLSGTNATIIKCDAAAYGPVTVPSSFENGSYPVKAIAQYAFANCTQITSVVLPASVESVGNYAFENCSGLTAVGLGGVATLGQYVFSGCTSLKEITLPKSLKKCEFSWSYDKPVSTFTGSSVESAVFESGIANIPECIFAQCSSLKSVRIPEKEDVDYGYTVDSYAFYKTGLTSVELPDSLTYVGAFAFAECAQLASAQIRDHVTTIGQHAFSGCTALETVSLGKSLKTIGNYAFEDDESLKEIVCPASLSSIGNYAFSGCKRISSFDLKNVSVLGQYVFYRCESLKQIVIPKTLSRCESSRPYGSVVSSFTDSGVETAVFEEGIANIPDAIFAGCYTLKSVSIPERKNDYEGYKIGANAFNGCYRLSGVELPESITAIGENAFANCSALGQLSIPKAVKSFDYSAFNGANVELVIPEEDSANALMLIDHQIPFIAVKTGFADTDARYLDRSAVAYYASMSTVSSSGYLPVTVRYAFKNEVKGDIRNLTLRIRMPADAGLVSDSFTVNGRAAAYNYADGLLTCSLDAESGVVTFAVQPDAIERFLSYAQFTYMLEGSLKTETAGTINLITKELTVHVPDAVSSRYITVTGTAIPNSWVTIYLDGTAAGSCRASATGIYKKDVLLPSSEGGEWFKIGAKADVDGEERSADTFVFYSPEAAKLKEFQMFYRGKPYDLIALEGQSPLIRWTDDAAFTFVVNFTDNNKVEDVTIVSTKADGVVELPAVYDAQEGRFIAAGFQGYVPGTITVTYREKKNNIFASSVVKPIATYEEADGTKGVKAHIALHDEDNTEFDFIKEVSENVTFTPSADYEMTSYNGRTAFVSRSPVYLEKEDSCYFVNEIYIRNSNSTCNVVRMGFGLTMKDLTDKGAATPTDATVTDATVTDATVTDAVPVTMKDLQENLYALKSLLARKYSSISSGSAAFAEAGKLVNAAIAKAEFDSPEWIDLSADSANLSKAEVAWDIVNVINGCSSTVTRAIAVSKDEWTEPAFAEDIAAAAEKISTVVMKESEKILRTVIDAMTKNGKNMTTLLEKTLKKDYSDVVSAFGGFVGRYSIDVTGYVYEALRSNRLSDVDITIYQTDPYGNAVVWNAEAYDQENPLKSDEDGSFSFDVPVGEWQVQFEKDGYETVRSAFTQVPPPVSGLEIGLISKNAPEVEYINVHTDLIEIKFTQFVRVSTVNTNTVKITQNGKSVTGLWEALNAEKDEAGFETLAERFQFILKDSLKDKVSITVSDVVNYAGTPMSQPYTVEKDISGKTKTISLPADLTVNCRESIDVTVKASPAGSSAGKTAVVTVDNGDLLALKETEVTFNEKGEAVLSFDAKLPGTAVITVKLNDTSVSAKTTVTISSEFAPCEHDWDDGEITVAATCLDTGLKTYTCKKCGEIQTETLAVLGHKEVKDKAVAPTCVETGLTKGSHCAICGEVFVAQEVIPAKGHVWDEGKVTTPATIEAEGIITFTCTVCGETKTEPTKRALGDVNGDGKIGSDDARLALRRSVALESFKTDSVAYRACDVDGDGKVTSEDARLILRASVQLEDPTTWQSAAESASL